MVHLAILLISPPFFLGVIAKTKATFAGRKGPPLLQMYYDLFRLCRKGTVYSRSTSVVLRLAPGMVCATLLMAGLFLPLSWPAPIHFSGDLIFFAYVLAFGRFLLLLSALDVGSSFAGMGASREATFGALSELAFFMGLVTLAVITRSVSFSGIFLWGGTHPMVRPAIVLLFLSFFLILLTENARVPIDDPNTHLELTMIHEAMLLDVGGPDLGLMLYGAAIKLFLFMVITVSCVWPPTGGFGLPEIGGFFAKMIGMAVVIGVVESSNSRLRLSKVPQLLVANFVITTLALLATILGGT
ncbi:MAG: NADH-quinone oxidoreductase subunit H [Deltaproteobacteria bacterium]|nr:NADH-quinone oxidoreductase subunit H [Deltaproteobacteria bacterium]